MPIIEKAYLGTILKENYLLKDTIIRPEQLQYTRHQELMRRMIEFQSKGKSIDLVTFTTIPDLDSFGGMSYLADVQSFADPEKFHSFEQSILELWKEREKRGILTLASLNDWDIPKVIHELDKINHAKMNDHTPIHEALIEIYEAPWNDQEPPKTVPSGIKELDVKTGGFHDGEVTIIAARPSMGKTDVMLHLAKTAGWNQYLPIVFSLEMPEKMVTNRLIASTGGFNRSSMRNPKGFLNQSQKKMWSLVIGNLDETNIQIFDAAGQTVAEMRAKTRHLMNQFPDKKPVIFIDYLTLIQSRETYGGNAHQQVTEISKNLKTMAKDFDCPVICLAQLNRSVESRANKRPMMSDIRESGSVEQDADVILFLYREKYYNKDSKDTTLEIIISKNRNGAVGTVPVHYDESTGRIVDLTDKGPSTTAS